MFFNLATKMIFLILNSYQALQGFLFLSKKKTKQNPPIYLLMY